MKRTLTTLAVVIAAGAAVLATNLAFAPNSSGQDRGGKAAAAGVKWEYKVVKLPVVTEQAVEKLLNPAGAEGWEAVGPISDVSGFNGSVACTSHMVLKRKL